MANNMRHGLDTTSCNVSVELWTFAADKTQLQILRALGPPLVPLTSTFRAVTWTGGNSSRSRPHGIVEYIDKLKSVRFNESFLRFAFQPFSVANTELVLTGIEFRLRVSPTSAMWESPYGHQGRTPAGERMRMFHESLERSLKWNGVESCPTVLEASFTFLGQAAREPFYSRFAPILAEAFDAAAKVKLLGCAYLDEESKFGVFERMAPWPKAYPLLQSCFDDLHPILIGPVQLCEDLCNSLREPHGKANPDRWRIQDDLAVVCLPEDRLNPPKPAQASYPFVVEKSERTQSVKVGQGQQFGVFRFGSAMFYTFRTYKQLITEGLLPSADAGHIYFPLIAANYCRMIRVDSDDMLVGSATVSFVDEIHSQIDDLFGRLSQTISVDKRVYVAHEQVYREKYGSVPGLFEPLWAYMKKTYFDERKS